MAHATTVSGIPCLVKVTSHVHQAPLGPTADSDWDCDGYDLIEFRVCDRRGRPAPWLERKLTKDDTERIEAELLQAHAVSINDDFYED